MSGAKNENSLVPMPRFDENYLDYDQADLEVIQANAHRFVQDAVEFGGSSLFFARQLDYVKSRVYNRKFPGMNADLLVPDATDVPEWAETITVSSYDSVGMAKVIANYADDLPRTDVRAMIQLVTVKTIGDSYGYNVNEIRASRAIGAGLDVRKADAARRAIDIKIAKIKMIGDPDYGLFGLFTQPNFPTVVLPNPGRWNTLTGGQMYANLNAMSFAYMMQTQGTHMANFLALAPEPYYLASTTLFTYTPGGGAEETSARTVLEMWQAQNPGITVGNIWECKGASNIAATQGQDVALLYELSPDNIAHEYVMPFSQLPPEARNLEFVIDCIARSGGVHVYYPLAFVSAVTGTTP